MSGFLLIDKPAGITSHDVVDALRRATGERRIGHAGTLDPFATGLLVVGVGRESTKQLSEFLGMDKEYEATAVLGATSDTQDATGAITSTGAALPDEAALRQAATSFIGDIEQIPPMYSAKKIHGKKLYELAREGKEIERKPHHVTIRSLEVTNFSPPKFSFRVRCSSGTYVRTLAHDIGAKLGCGAYLETLRRTAIGALTVSAALPLTRVDPENWRGLLADL